MSFKPTFVAATLFASLALGACASAPQKIDSLEQARTSYARAAEDPAVARHAPKELDAAKAALEKAETPARRGRGPGADIDFQADARVQARAHRRDHRPSGREADRRIEDAKLDRQRAQLELRESRAQPLEGRDRSAPGREAEELKRQHARRHAGRAAPSAAW